MPCRVRSKTTHDTELPRQPSSPVEGRCVQRLISSRKSCLRGVLYAAVEGCYSDGEEESLIHGLLTKEAALCLVSAVEVRTVEPLRVPPGRFVESRRPSLAPRRRQLEHAAT